jgi:hypothetical protein
MTVEFDVILPGHLKSSLEEGGTDEDHWRMVEDEQIERYLRDFRKVHNSFFHISSSITDCSTAR